MADIPKTVVDHAKLLKALQVDAIVAARSAWANVSPDFISESWQAALPGLLGEFQDLRWTAAFEGSAYAAQTLADQGTYVAPEAFVDPDAFIEFTPTGGEVAEALYIPAIRAKQAIERDGVSRAMTVGRTALEYMVAFMIVDTARQATGVDLAARGVGYTRMLNPPSCMRCTILAGRFYRWNKGFLRHPRCDCVHVPAAVKSTRAALDEGLIDDPYEYFRSLSEAEQDKLFGPYDARAIRDGADIFQVVNSRRGRAKNGLFTTEGTTRRGYFRQKNGVRYPKRGTPEWIYRTAELKHYDRAQVLSMLENGGYILPGGQNPAGVLRGQREGFGQMGRGGTRRRASEAVLRARATGVRDPGNPYTMTAAERRLWDAEQALRDARLGYYPYTEAAMERRWGLPRTSGPDRPITPDQLASIERAYRHQLFMGGEKFLPDDAGVLLMSGRSRVLEIDELFEVSRTAHAGLVASAAGGGGILPPRSRGGLNHNDWSSEDDPHLDGQLLQKIVYGRGKVGGHAYGMTPAGKKVVNHEFPQWWTVEDIANAYEETLHFGNREHGDKGTVIVKHNVNGVDCTLTFNPVNKDPRRTVEFYPEGGDGVMIVRNGKRKPWKG